MITNNTLSTIINSTVRTVTGKVEMYEGTTLKQTFAHTDKLIEFTIERVGEEKFFGFGVCQKINVKLLDVKREITVTTANSFKLYFNNVNTSPIFYVTEVNRDEKTNELSITAYDIINQATNHKTSELALTAPYTIKDFANSCASLLGLGAVVFPTDMTMFNLYYSEGANFEGTENIREALNAVAEATLTIYYINQSSQLVFKQLDKDGDPVYIIDKSRYFELDSKTNRRLVKITHATELGDNVSAELEQTGTTQYVRNNPFWDLRTDIDSITETALDLVGGLTINQFECEWRGNPLLEVGDKIALTTKDDDAVLSYIINDVITYNGSLVEESQWHYTDDEGTEDNPATLGDALKYTYARVDKVNKEITLMASDVDEHSQKLAKLEIDVDTITTTVSKIEKSDVEVGSKNLLRKSKDLSEVYKVGGSIEDCGGNEGINAYYYEFGVIDNNTSDYVSDTCMFFIPINGKRETLLSQNLILSFDFCCTSVLNPIVCTPYMCYQSPTDTLGRATKISTLPNFVPVTYENEEGETVLEVKEYITKNNLGESPYKVIGRYHTYADEGWTLINGEWLRLSYSFTPTDIFDRNTEDGLDGTYWICFDIERKVIGTSSQALRAEYAIRKPQLEIGNVASSWSPAPEDFEEEATTKIEQNAENITLSASRIDASEEAISSLQINADSISASVKEIETVTTTAIDGINEELATLTKSVETKMTSEDVSILISQELSNGVESVTTSTGFTFNQEGLTISKSDSEMSTLVDEDGMTIYKNDEVMLDVNNVGVDAQNINVRTYLIIGQNSRFEDYGDNRTGCFFIGQTTTTTSEE